MNKILLSSMILVASVAASHSETIVDNIDINNFTVEREGNYLALGMDLGLADLDVKSNQCVLLVPRIVNGNDSISLPAIGVYGRTRYYYYLRNYGAANMSGSTETSYLAKNKPAEIAYTQMVPYSEWMDGANFTLERIDRGCCQDTLLDRYGVLGNYHDAFFPDLLYVRPQGIREKRRQLEGSSYIDFPVDRTEIY
ncbi:MAG: DUF3868 domain-containing protein, partial [Muribaculaceae bacterium]|nr:DUF3868 domain-containing protein [Muribaculaceae bacterium]